MGDMAALAVFPLDFRTWMEIRILKFFVKKIRQIEGRFVLLS